MPHHTWISFSFGDHEHVVHNTQRLTWSEFKAKAPFIVNSVGVAYFFIDSPENFDEFLKKMDFIRHNVTIQPGHEIDFPIFPQPGASGEQWLPKTDQEIRARLRSRVINDVAETHHITPGAAADLLLKHELSKRVPEEQWSCPSCGCTWPISAVEESWRVENRCDACK